VRSDKPAVVFGPGKKSSSKNKKPAVSLTAGTKIMKLNTLPGKLRN